MKNITLCGLLAVLFSGCASVAVSDDALQSRTASALGLRQGEFTISNRQDSGVRTDYTVTASGSRTYSCYVTGIVSVVGRSVSDAMCSQTSAGKSTSPAPTAKAEKPASTSCNALLKAAGKC